MQRGHVTREAGKNHGRGFDIRAKKPGEQFKKASEHKKHPRLKQYRDEVHFNVTRRHGKVVQTVELHEWRKYGHQHDQDEHDFWHLALHNS